MVVVLFKVSLDVPVDEAVLTHFILEYFSPRPGKSNLPISEASFAWSLLAHLVQPWMLCVSPTVLFLFS